MTAMREAPPGRRYGATVVTKFTVGCDEPLAMLTRAST
jgi:hypothetical protein